jgi:coenzyme F420-0:L-glutamate ligase / coenzyme F420-1:gamma-L-glutamate ligase
MRLFLCPGWTIARPGVFSFAFAYIPIKSRLQLRDAIIVVMNRELRIIPITGIGEILSSCDLGSHLFMALKQQQLTLEPGDIFVITQKVVSKAEGRVINLDTVEPSSFAYIIAQQAKKDPRHVEIVLRESKRIVRMDRGIIISETHHGFVCANAGVDESNIDGADLLTLLPVDPDESAGRIRKRLQEIHHPDSTLDLAVIISDTWGRPWRNGQVNMAIGCAGIAPLVDYRGQYDPYGYEMQASMIAIADELASAAELVMGKVDRIPVALIRGYCYIAQESSICPLLREHATDMFR